MVENQTDRKLKSLRSDNEGEYKSDKFAQFCRECGMRREFIAPHSPEQNGIAERINRTIRERIVSTLHHSGLSNGFWAEALLTTVHIINMSSSRPLGSKIPQELWTQRKPDYGKLRIFGCEAYALVPRDERHKLESRSRKCIFLGYGPDGSFSYRLWDPETHQVVRSSNMVFNESAMHKSTDRPIEVWRVTFSDVVA
jgi:transposase InsO family protein